MDIMLRGIQSAAAKTMKQLIESPPVLALAIS